MTYILLDSQGGGIKPRALHPHHRSRAGATRAPRTRHRRVTRPRRHRPQPRRPWGRHRPGPQRPTQSRPGAHSRRVRHQQHHRLPHLPRHRRSHATTSHQV